MKKGFILLILALIISIVIPLVPARAATATSLSIHYKRYDALYSEWDLWLWAPGEDGSDYAFNDTDDYGAVAEISLTGALSGLSELGIIVKKGSISSGVKDIVDDRFIGLTKPDQTGHVDVYVLEGVSFMSYVLEDTPLCDRDGGSPNPYYCAQDLSPRIIKAYFNAEQKIEFQLSQTVVATNVSIIKNGTPVDYTGFTGGNSGTITLTDPVDTLSIYMLQISSESFTDESIIIFGSDYDSAMFAEAYHYDGWLGFQYTETQTTFRVWAPLSSKASVNLFSKGHTTSQRADGVNAPYDVIEMDYIGEGVWETTVIDDLHEVYYTFNVVNDGVLVSNIADPYGVTFGLNGMRSMVIDFDQVNPEGWDTDEGVKGYDTINDWIIYELHVRDLTSHSSWNGPEAYRGKYMGLTYEGTSYTNSTTQVTVSTGLDHLVELGITHLHLLPTYDQDSYNNEQDFQFNWGYNPQNYNSPEGGYSTDPYNGSVRVNEFKQMVQALHSNGINVILDKVYNHTGNGVQFSMNRIVPNYVYRLDTNGNFSNGTGVGNETASERYMFRKFMIDSAVFWAEEYHIDGLRFDLMAVHDVETMNQLTDAVKQVNDEIQVYGEPWGGGTIALPYELQAGKNNIKQMPEISAFNDQFRDTIKGSTFTESDPGFITNGESVSDIKKGIIGSVNWGWGLTSSQSINYISAHDNLTLYDKLLKANGRTSYSLDIDYQARLGNSIVLFSQGVPFLHAGVDFLRTKGGNHNSYNASDAVNQLNWIRKSLYEDSFEYYKGLIALRKTYESFKMTDSLDIQSHLSFLNLTQQGLVGYQLTKNDENLLIYHNSGSRNNEIILPSGAWKLLVNQKTIDLDGIATYQSTYPIRKAETLVFVPGNQADVITSPTLPPEITNTLRTVYESAAITIRTSTDVTSYQINGSDFINLPEPTKAFSMGQLEPGVYQIVVKNSNGDLSEIFTLTVLETIVQPDPILITNETQVFYQGDIIMIYVSRDVIKYKLNDGDYVNLSSPTSVISLIGLDVGDYTITVSDVENVESSGFEFSVLESVDEIPDDELNFPVYAYVLIGGIVLATPIIIILVKRKRLHRGI
jgi:pullulanase